MSNQRLKFVIEGIIIIAAVLLISVFAFRRTSLPGGASALVIFPADVPVSAVGVVKDASTTVSSGQLELIRSFTSSQSASTTFALYKNFFSSASGTWALLAQVNRAADPVHKSVFARSGAGMITVDITATPSSTSLVAIMFVSGLPQAP